MIKCKGLTVEKAMAPKYDKGNFTTNKENGMVDLPSIKMVRQSLTALFKDNKRKATMLPKLHSLREATESLIAGTNRKTINSSVVPTNSSVVVKKIPAIVSSSKSLTIAGPKTTSTRKSTQNNAVSSKPRRSVKRQSIQSVNRKINQSKTVLQKNVTKVTVAAGPSNLSQRKFKNLDKSTTYKFQCKNCEKSFLLKTTLIAHQKCHTDANSNCPHCQRTFEKPIALSKHLRENCTKISAAARKKLLAEDEQLAELNQTMQRSTDLELTKLKPRDLHLRQRITGIYQTPKKAIQCIHCGEKFMDVVLFATHAELHANKMKSM